eukprot:7383310-Prymnesium_polylepis.1
MGLLQRLRKSWHGDSVSSSSRTCSRSAPADGADAKVQYLCPADSHAPQVLPPQMRVDAIYTTVLAKWTAAAPAQPSSERRFAAAIPHPRHCLPSLPQPYRLCAGGGSGTAQRHSADAGGRQRRAECRRAHGTRATVHPPRPAIHTDPPRTQGPPP